MRWLFLLLAVNAAAVEPGYLDPATCRSCHRKIFDAYQQTAMGKTFTKAETVPPLSGFFHAPSQLQYSILKRDGSYFLRRSSPPFEKRLDYAIGSGNHSTTFVHRAENGKLKELPVSWYSENGGFWNMSPGYDRPDHSDFRREVADSCLFCHNGYPSKANGGIARGLDCQRCHGPGELHAAGKGPIVNPAKLSPQRGLEVCLQCHLESASRTLPDAIRRLGRTPFSYRPGEPLGGFMLYFEFANSPAEDRITVNGSGYGLLKSKCFSLSSGRLTCTTCHNPHRQLTSLEAEQHYTQVCRGCHAAAHQASTRDCASCHMRKRRTEDAVHVVLTDHRIRRTPLPGDPLAPLPERHERLSGKIALLYPPELPASPETDLYLAMAQRDPVALRKAIANTKPAEVDPYLVLAEVLQKAGRAQDAIQAFRQIIQKFPNDPRGYIAASQLLMDRGEVDLAVQLMQPALARMPNDPALLNSLAVLYSSKQRFEDALPLLSKAVQAEPEDPLSWLNLGVCLEATGDRNGAAAAYQQTLALDPGSPRARIFLQRLAEH